MATLGDLKTRLILETDRDDMGASGESVGVLTTAISRAIDFYSGQEFWFNRASGTVSTSNGVAYVARPAAVRIPLLVAYNGGLLRKVRLQDIEWRTESGIPARWADNEANIQLSPTPDGTYSLSVYGLAQIDAPSLDADTNVWTTEAYDLIANRAKAIIFEVFKEYDAMDRALGREQEALSRLRSETRRRSVTNASTDLVTGQPFNIATG